MVIVWRLRGNIIWTVLYWQRATSSMGTVNRNSSHSPVGPWVCLICVFWVAWFVFMLVYVLFYLGQLSRFPSCCGADVANLGGPPLSFLLPPRCCGLGAGSIPLGAIVSGRRCETRRWFCRWSSTAEWEMCRTPGVFLFPKTRIITCKGTI